jgi:predicted translin family RNA/ssDNA-binding protein
MELDARHDKYERLVKLSRDITITSKRIIFQIHRISSDEHRLKVISDVEKKLAELERTKWYQVAVELDNEDPFLFLRAYSPGLQEYIEAVSLYYYTKSHTLVDLATIQHKLTFTPCQHPDLQSTNNLPPAVKVTSDAQLVGSSALNEPVLSIGATELTMSTSSQSSVSVHIPPIDYILGLADVTGELMRLAVHSAGVGDTKTPFDVCCVLRQICTALASFDGIGREFQQKLSTLRQSITKVEAACYAIHMRMSELPCTLQPHVPVFVAPLVIPGFGTECTPEYVD